MFPQALTRLVFESFATTHSPCSLKPWPVWCWNRLRPYLFLPQLVTRYRSSLPDLNPSSVQKSHLDPWPDPPPLSSLNPNTDLHSFSPNDDQSPVISFLNSNNYLMFILFHFLFLLYLKIISKLMKIKRAKLFFVWLMLMSSIVYGFSGTTKSDDFSRYKASLFAG